MSSSADRLILNAVVNPMLPLGEGVFDDQESLPVGLQDDEMDTDGVRLSKELETQAIKLVDLGQIDAALNLFDKAVEEAPDRPAVYNNRAQVYRLKGNDTLALEDLNRSLELSKGIGRSACQALCQRGMLYRKQYLDVEARSDFEKAANMGSEFAKSVLVQMNPYAAMCNKMLKNVFIAMEEGNQNIENPFSNLAESSK